MEKDRLTTPVFLAFPGDSSGKESTCNEETWVQPLLGKILWRAHGNQLHYLCLENVHGQRSLVSTVKGLKEVEHDWYQAQHSTGEYGLPFISKLYAAYSQCPLCQLQRPILSSRIWYHSLGVIIQPLSGKFTILGLLHHGIMEGAKFYVYVECFFTRRVTLLWMQICLSCTQCLLSKIPSVDLKRMFYPH